MKLIVPLLKQNTLYMYITVDALLTNTHIMQTVLLYNVITTNLLVFPAAPKIHKAGSQFLLQIYLCDLGPEISSLVDSE